MKVKAMANLSGPFGRKVKDETFDMKADEARALIDRKLAEEVETTAPATKPESPKKAE